MNSAKINNREIFEEVASLKVHVKTNREDIGEIKDDIREIKENHLAHLKDDLNTIKVRLAFIAGGLAALQVLVEKFL